MTRRSTSPARVIGAKASVIGHWCVIFFIQIAAAAAIARAVTGGCTPPAGGAGVARRTARHGIAAVTAAPAAQTGALFQHRAAGLFDVLWFNFPEKAAGLVALGAAIEHPGDAVGDVKLLLGAGDTHIGQAAFLLEVSLGILAHLTGEDALFHANEEYIGKLKALG